MLNFFIFYLYAYLEDIYLGIISGLFTAFFIWFGQSLWKMKIEPYIINKLYTGFRINGEWYEEHCILDSQMKQYSDIKIKQIGSKIKGTIYITKENIDEVKFFEVKGEIVGDLITLMSYNKNHSQIGGQTYILTTILDGRALSGKKNYYEISATNKTECIKTLDILWKRKEYKEYVFKPKENNNNS